MDRRAFTFSSLALAGLPSLGLASIDYEPGLVRSLLAEGKTVFLTYATGWCTTCAAQKRIMAALWNKNADYEANIVFVRIDYDLYGRAELAKQLDIPRRSTLVVLRGEVELGRNVAGTSRKSIKALFDIALEAALAT